MIKTQSQTTFKDFQMLSRLGEGSYSSVYKVKRLSDNKIYAFKRVKMDLLNSKEKENALNEVRILASITDPFIIGYNEAFFDENTNSLCIVMEYAEEGDLQKLIKTAIDHSSHIPEEEIWRCLIHMTKGLKTLHEMSILHRDLKCANVFISNENSKNNENHKNSKNLNFLNETHNGNLYKLGDLNVSKVAAKGLVYTQTGTPYYASPEVWRDEPYDMKSDIWSLGCVLYEMAALKPPFRANDMKGLFIKVQKGVFERIPKIYSEDLMNIISEFLKVQPSLRPNSQQILSNHIVMKYMKEICGEFQENSKAKLLGTIEVPKNLKFLKERLPRANYSKEKLNSSFEKAKNTGEIQRNLRGESAGSKREEKNRVILKETVFKEEILMKINSVSKKLEEEKNVKKSEELLIKKKTEEISMKKNEEFNRKNPEIIIEKKNNSRPGSRGSIEKKIDLHSPLPIISMKNSKIVIKSPRIENISEIKPLLSPKALNSKEFNKKDLNLDNMKQINEFLSNHKSPVIVSPLQNIKKNETIFNEIISKGNAIRPNSRYLNVKNPQRPYSQLEKRTEEIYSGIQRDYLAEKSVKPQIRMNARPMNRNLKNLRPFSGVDREKIDLYNMNNNKNININVKNTIIVKNSINVKNTLNVKNSINVKNNLNNYKEMPAKKKNVVSMNHLHSNKRIDVDSIDLLKNELQKKLEKPGNYQEIGVVLRNKNVNIEQKPQRIYSGNNRIGNIRKISYEENANILRNKANLQEKPITAPNVSRGQYKIIEKNRNYRAILGQQIVNNNYKIFVKEKKNL